MAKLLLVWGSCTKKDLYKPSLGKSVRFFGKSNGIFETHDNLQTAFPFLQHVEIFEVLYVVAFFEPMGGCFIYIWMSYTVKAQRFQLKLQIGFNPNMSLIHSGRLTCQWEIRHFHSFWWYLPRLQGCWCKCVTILLSTSALPLRLVLGPGSFEYLVKRPLVPFARYSGGIFFPEVGDDSSRDLFIP